MEGEMGRMRSAGLLFLFFFFSCLVPLFLRIVGMDEEEEEMSRKNKKYNESRLGKQAIGFCCTESVPKKKSMPCLPSLPLFSLLLLHYPNDRTPVSQNPHPFPIPYFFSSFLSPSCLYGHPRSYTYPLTAPS